MSGRLGVRELVVDQLGTMRVDNTRRVNLGDVLVFWGVPLTVGLFMYFTSQRFRGTGDILAGVTLLTGLMFALLVHVFTLRLRIVDMPQYGASSRVSALVDDLRANVSYACAASLTFTMILIVSSINAGPRAEVKGLHPAVSGAVTFVGVHLAVVLLMVIKKLRTAYKLLS